MCALHHDAFEVVLSSHVRERTNERRGKPYKWCAITSDKAQDRRAKTRKSEREKYPLEALERIRGTKNGSSHQTKGMVIILVKFLKQSSDPSGYHESFGI